MAHRAVLSAALLAWSAPASAGLTCEPGAIAGSAAAALGQFESANECGQAEALKWLNKLFKNGVPKERAKEVLFNGDADPAPYRRPPGKDRGAVETTPITADMLDKAVAHIRGRLRSGGVAAACTRDDVSGYWGPEPDCPYSVCGKLELGGRWVAKVQNSSFESEMALRDADQVANSVTHELVHVLVSYFRRVYGAEDAPTIEGGLQEDFQYFTFFTGCGLQEVNPAARAHQPIEYKAPGDMYDPSRTGNEQAARMIAHGMQRCFNRKPNPFYFQILGAPSSVATCGR